MRGRLERIRAALRQHKELGWVEDYYCYAPGDRGRRWVVWGPGVPGREQTLSTREVEALIRELDRRELAEPLGGLIR